ncbi:MAG: hypothetical protein KKB50_13865 [Planctomycetes bacterium]|nr:hypothetical protein [Planctomycetota bacterium]
MPEAKAARRDAWRPLTYILANHILLPRLELVDTLAGQRRIDEESRDLMNKATQAGDVSIFVRDAATVTKPPASLHRLLESVFDQVTPGALTGMERELAAALHAPGPPAAPPGWGELRVVGWLLPAFSHPRQTLTEFGRLIFEYTFERSFAIALFPAIYWQACRCWPLEKVIMCHALHAPEAQIELYDAVRYKGLSLEHLDRALLGEGALGKAVRGIQQTRPSVDRAPEQPDGEGAPRCAFPLGERDDRFVFRGATPPNDAVFDYLDRCRFLERLPFIKADRRVFADLACSLTLPSWNAWVAHVTAHSLPEGTPPRIPERFRVLFHPFTDLDERMERPDAVRDYLGRLLAQKAQAAMASRFAADDWSSIRAAARALGFRANRQAIIDTLGAPLGESEASKPKA